MKQWVKERCSSRPPELQLVGAGIYIQRRNVKEQEHSASERIPAYTYYLCESREITVSEYEMLKSIEGIDTSRAIDEYTMQLVEMGVL